MKFLVRKYLILFLIFSFSKSIYGYDSLSLVVGSQRLGSSFKFPFYSATVWGEDQVDREHERTFGGKAVTMDIGPCISEDPILRTRHIQADARTYDFRAHGYEIKEVFLERLPTFDHNNPADCSPNGNVTGQVVLNLARAMQPGASIAIEWDPYNNCPGAANASENIRNNPFNGFVSIRAFFTLMQRELFDFKRRQIPKKLFVPMQSALTIPYEALMLRVEEELKVFIEFENYKQKGCAYLFVAPLLGKYYVYGVNSQIIDQIEQGEGQPIECLDGFRINMNDTMGRIFSSAKFFECSCIAILMRWYICQINQKYVKAFMEQHGFKDVKITFGDCKYNNRKNAYGVEAVRNDIPVDQLPAQVQPVN